MAPAALKDALMFCLDVGPGTAQPLANGKSALDNALDVIKLMLQRKLFAESKDLVGLVLFGCDDTNNELAEDEMYQHISVVSNLLPASFDILEYITKNVQTGSHDGDFLDAVTVCLDVLHNIDDGNIDRRHIILLSNLTHPHSEDNLAGIVNGFKNEGKEIEFHVIAPEFKRQQAEEDDETDDEDMPGPSHGKRPKTENLQQKPKAANQLSGEKTLWKMMNEVDGAVYTFDAALQQTTNIEKKAVRSVAWKCDLEIGKNLAIPCAAYVKVKKSTLKHSWKKCHAKTHKVEDLEVQKYYTLNDNDQTEVDKDNVIKGFKYGKDVIPFSKEDQQATKYPSEGKCLQILGFTNASNIQRQLFCGDQTHIIVPVGRNEAALSAIVQAMNNQTMCAVARYLYRKGLNPKLVALIPKVKDKSEHLVMVTLPYAEDARNLDFAGISKEMSVSDEQEEALDEFIDSLTTYKQNELYKPKQMPNPYFQRIFQCLHSRAMGEKELPECNNNIKSILEVDPLLKQNSSEPTKKIKTLFKVHENMIKKVKASKGKDAWEDKTSNGQADVAIETQNILSNAVAKIKSVGTVNPQDDFISIVDNQDENIIVQVQAFNELQQRVMEFINEFFLSGINPKVIPCIKLLRRHAIKLNKVQSFNEFLNKVKEKVVLQNSYWSDIVKETITLIGMQEHQSGVDEETSKNFLKEDAINKKSLPEESTLNNDTTDADDLLDML